MGKVTHSDLLIRPQEKWYLQKVNQPESNRKPLSRDKENGLKREAEQLFETEAAAYRQSLEKGPKKSEFDWMWKVLKTGSLVDKLSVHSLLNQDSAVHNLSSLRAMLQMCHSKGKREYLLSSQHLKDLLLADVLPAYKLKFFGELVTSIPSEPRLRSIHLILSYYEDQLKQIFKEFIDLIERMSHDTVVVTKSKSILFMYEILCNTPEQEQFLLSSLVNKLGDPCPKASSHALHLIVKLITSKHPAMKEVVVCEVERLLFRANVKPQTQYRCLCLMQSIRLGQDDVSLGNRLMAVYFGFFAKCVKQGDVNNKTMSVILSGVSRGLPFSSQGTGTVHQHLNTFFKMIHLVNSSIAIQIFALLLHVVIASSHKKRTKDDVSADCQLVDRFFSSLYRFLLKQDLFESSSRLATLFNLIFRALKCDSNCLRVYAFLKRLLQISFHTPSQISAAIIFLVSEVLKNKKPAAHLFYAEHMNSSLAGRETSCVSKKLVSKKRGPKEKEEVGPQVDDSSSKGFPSSIKHMPSQGYDVSARNPSFAGSETTSTWELRLLTRHFHPSVSAFADAVTDRKSVDYDGDPLHDFSLKKFLDRFVRRKPKKEAEDSAGQDLEEDNMSIGSDEFEEILEKNEKNLLGDDDDVEWGDLSDEEWGSEFGDDDEDKDLDSDEAFDSDEYFDELADSMRLSESGDCENYASGVESFFAPADEVEEDGEGNLIIRNKIPGRKRAASDAWFNNKTAKDPTIKKKKKVKKRKQ